VNGRRLQGRLDEACRPGGRGLAPFGRHQRSGDTRLRFIPAGDFAGMLLAGRYTLVEQGAPLERVLPEWMKGRKVIGDPGAGP